MRGLGRTCFWRAIRLLRTAGFVPTQSDLCRLIPDSGGVTSVTEIKSFACTIAGLSAHKGTRVEGAKGFHTPLKPTRMDHHGTTPTCPLPCPIARTTAWTRCTCLQSSQRPSRPEGPVRTIKQHCYSSGPRSASWTMVKDALYSRNANMLECSAIIPSIV